MFDCLWNIPLTDFSGFPLDIRLGREGKKLPNLQIFRFHPVFFLSFSLFHAFTFLGDVISFWFGPFFGAIFGNVQFKSFLDLRSLGLEPGIPFAHLRLCSPFSPFGKRAVGQFNLRILNLRGSEAPGACP